MVKKIPILSKCGFSFKLYRGFFFGRIKSIFFDRIKGGNTAQILSEEERTLRLELKSGGVVGNLRIKKIIKQHDNRVILL